MENLINECPICGIDINSEYYIKLDCGHEFHYECLLKSLKNTTKRKHINCPYCRKECNYLPIVNGLKKIELGIHINYQDYYKKKGLNVLYDSNLNYLKSEPCKALITRGKRKGQVCGKYCKIGSYYCGGHKKFDNLLSQYNKSNKLGDKQEKIEIEIAEDISKKLLENQKKKSTIKI
jgi:hypothetical protein